MIVSLGMILEYLVLMSKQVTSCIAYTRSLSAIYNSENNWFLLAHIEQLLIGQFFSRRHFFRFVYWSKKGYNYVYSSVWISNLKKIYIYNALMNMRPFFMKCDKKLKKSSIVCGL